MSAARSVHLLTLATAIALLAGCAQNRQKPIYMWEAFPRQQYDTLLSHGAPPLDQIANLEAHAEKARATGAALPPGFRAHLGMLKLNAGDTNEARRLWLAEKTAFPESAPYMDQLLKRLDAPAKKDKPA
ncbi:MAG: DUF4810 domain-containing protein [Cytophagales bacterium]|nr:DUF4810 domain-containing protein [Rhizobacter sp.]